MVKFAFVAGAALTLAGVAAGCWPDDNALARGRRLVPVRTYERRGPTVIVHAGAERARVSAGGAVSVTGVLGADGYWVRSRPGYITRERLIDTKVLVLDRPWDRVGDGRTTTLLSRWIQEGGAVLMVTRGEGPETRRVVGAGRIAVIDPSAFGTAEFVARFLDAMHWLD